MTPPAPRARTAPPLQMAIGERHLERQGMDGWVELVPRPHPGRRRRLTPGTVPPSEPSQGQGSERICDPKHPTSALNQPTVPPPQKPENGDTPSPTTHALRDLANSASAWLSHSGAPAHCPLSHFSSQEKQPLNAVPLFRWVHPLNA